MYSPRASKLALNTGAESKPARHSAIDCESPVDKPGFCIHIEHTPAASGGRITPRQGGASHVQS